MHLSGRLPLRCFSIAEGIIQLGVAAIRGPVEGETNVRERQEGVREHQLECVVLRAVQLDT